MQARQLFFVPLVPRVQARSKVKLRLICLPYAGGSAAVFNNWPTHLPATVSGHAKLTHYGKRNFTHPPFDRRVGNDT